MTGDGKVFDEINMVDVDYREICRGDEERQHWYFYREPEPENPQFLDVRSKEEK